MRSFKAGNVQYVISIDVPTIESIKAAHKIDMLDFRAAMASLASDPILAVHVIADLVAPSDRAVYYRDMVGDAIADGVEALLGAIVDFFPNRGMRSNLERCLEKAKEVMEAKQVEASKMIESISADSFSASPELSGSSPGPA